MVWLPGELTLSLSILLSIEGSVIKDQNSDADSFFIILLNLQSLGVLRTKSLHPPFRLNKNFMTKQICWRRQTQPDDGLWIFRWSDNQRFSGCSSWLVTPRNPEKVFNRHFPKRRISFFPPSIFKLCAHWNAYEPTSKISRRQVLEREILTWQIVDRILR